MTRTQLIRALVAAAPAAALAVLAGCASLAPPLPKAEPQIPAQWPAPPAPTAGASAPAPSAAGAPATPAAAETPAADIGWRDFFVDPALKELIGLALAHNRDLRISVLDVERARALYRVQRADRFPTLGATASESHSGGGSSRPASPDLYTVSVGITSFELDLFGRVHDLSRSALQQYFAQDATRRAAQISLVAEVADAWLTLAADQESLRIARETLTTRSEAYRLVGDQHTFGAASGLDVAQAQTLMESARADVARFSGAVESDRNALRLLVGAPIEERLFPTRLDATATGSAPIPAGLPSTVLLRRPDVEAAEHQLRAANASVGAARAAFFPSIKLTAGAGTMSTELSGLFSGGSQFWSFAPQVDLSILDPGRLEGNLQAARAEQAIALAQYEKAVQSGFREVSDALALTQTLAAQRDAQQAFVAAATRSEHLSLARYRAGRDSYLVELDAQRTLYAAQQSLVASELAVATNRVTLYKVLGGGWVETTR